MPALGLMPHKARAFSSGFEPYLYTRVQAHWSINVTSESSALSEISRFVKAFDLDDALNAVASIEDLKTLLVDFDSPLSGSLIPLEQATRIPKILVDSGITQAGIPWRTLQCPGGPLVLQMICEKVNFALWIEEC